MPKLDNIACVTGFVFKSPYFAQILEKFAQTYVFTSATFRNSEDKEDNYLRNDDWAGTGEERKSMRAVQMKSSLLPSGQPDSGPDGAVKTQVDGELRLGDAQTRLGVMDGGAPVVHLLLGAAAVGGAGLLQLVPERPEQLVERRPAGAVVTLEEPEDNQHVVVEAEQLLERFPLLTSSKLTYV